MNTPVVTPIIPEAPIKTYRRWFRATVCGRKLSGSMLLPDRLRCQCDWSDEVGRRAIIAQAVKLHSVCPETAEQNTSIEWSQDEWPVGLEKVYEAEGYPVAVGFMGGQLVKVSRGGSCQPVALLESIRLRRLMEDHCERKDASFSWEAPALTRWLKMIERAI